LAAIEGNLPRLTAQVDAVGFFNFFPMSMVPFVASL